MIRIAASNIKKGDHILNLGIVEDVEQHSAARLTYVKITQGLCLSCAFYWFYNTAILTLQVSDSEKQS